MAEAVVYRVTAPSRLDLFLSVETGRTRNFVKYQIKKSRVAVNGNVVDKPSHKVRANDTIECRFIEEGGIGLQPVEMALEILYEDPDLLVLNKAQGWVVHPASAHKGETVVHYLLHHFRNSPGFSDTSPTRPGVVHRLDRGTSGCLLIAKHRAALESLSQQFKDRVVEKEYEAVVWGKTPKGGVMKNSIGRHRSDRKKMSSKTRMGKDALTKFETVGVYASMSWVRLMPKTGRTHQLRVHLSEMGNPIVADSLYGRKRNLDHLSESQRSILEASEFPYLHARRLSFQQPTTKQQVTVEARRPKIFDELLAALKGE